MDLNHALYHYFGYSDFRPGQEAAISHALIGKNTLVVMPTGSGKSLVFQLTALLTSGTTLVISPLKSLMKDQVDSLTRRGIAATFIDSTLSPLEVNLRLGNIREDKYKLVYVAPERISSASFRSVIKDIKIGILAVDEAHCVSQWGHDFRPDYLRVAEMREQLGSPFTLALTATATPQVQDEIVRLLGIDGAERIVTGFNRPNLELEVLRVSNDTEKIDRMCRFLADTQGAGIIYAGTRLRTEKVASLIRERTGLIAQHYHAGLDDNIRAKIQEGFLAKQLPIIVATIAFGMGIDRSDVRYVLHYEMSGTLEAYYQEVGRAGRDGAASRAILLYSPKDRELHDYFIREESPSASDLRRVHDFLTREPSSTLDAIKAATFIERNIAAIIKELENAGAARMISPISRGIVSARILPIDEKRLQDTVEKIERRREHKVGQLDKMVQYAELETCRRRFLLDHFGDTSPENAEPCCDRCRGRILAPTSTVQAARIRPSVAFSSTDAEELGREILSAVAEAKPEIGITRLAHILTGSIPESMLSSSMRRFHGKLDSHDIEYIVDQINHLIDRGYLEHIVAKAASLVKLTLKGGKVIDVDVPRRTQTMITKEQVAEEKKEQRPPATQQTERRLRLMPSVIPHSPASLRPSDGFASEVHQWGASARRDKIPELIRALSHENGNVRRLAASALGKLRDTSAVDSLLLLLADERSPQVRQYAISALGKIRDPRARETLQRISANIDEVAYNRKAADTALDELPKENHPSGSLYDLLYAWRKEKSRVTGIPAPAILSDKVLGYIVIMCPKTRQELLRILAKDLASVNLYGAEILRLVARSDC